MADNKENNKWSRPPQPPPPPPPPTPPLSCYGVEKKEHSENKDFVTCRFFLPWRFKSTSYSHK